MDDDIAREFPQDEQTLYLNHAAVAPWPYRAQQAVTDFARQNTLFGARHYPRWVKTEDHLRHQLQQLLSAPSVDDIALLKNTSEGLSVIAAGLSWQPGDQVVITNQEFPSNRIPWQALQSRGVSTLEADIAGNDPEQAIIDLLTDKTRLLSVSSVQYGSGLRLDLKRLGDACQQRQILFCVDAIQSLGAFPMDVTDYHADFVVADGHKWMLGPEGLAVFYSTAQAREQLSLTQYGWHMIEDAGNYDRKDWQPALSARRFECGSPNLLGTHALSASLSLLLEVGIDQIAREIHDRVDYLISRLLSSHQVVLLSPSDHQRRSGIVTFRLNNEAPEASYQRLKQSGVVCAQRGGGVRFSPHFYTPYRVIDRALGILLNTD